MSKVLHDLGVLDIFFLIEIFKLILTGKLFEPIMLLIIILII